MQADDFVPVPSSASDAFVRQMREFGILLGSSRHASSPAFHVDNLAAARRALAAHRGDAALMAQFQTHIDADEDHFRRALRPIVVRSAVAGQAPSLARLLLGHAQLQAPVAALLLERFCVSIEDEERFVRVDLCDNVPKLILRQLRFLECVHDGPALAAKLVEVLSAVPTFAKRELLSCLPEIVDDSCHAIVVPALQVELEQSPELAVPILDAVAQLNVDPHLLADTRRAAVGLLRATRITDTPLVVRFLVLSAPADSCNATVDTLRDQLASLLREGVLSERGGAEDEYAHHGKSRKATKASLAGKVDAVALLIDSLRAALGARRDVAKAWMAQLELAAKRATAALEDSAAPVVAAIGSALGASDVWFLLCQHASGADGARDTDALIRRLVACELLSGDALCEAVSGEFAACVELLGSSAVALAGSLVRGATQAQRLSGGAFYRALFGAMKSSAPRTGLIGALVAHVGSAAPLEMEVALQTLVELAEARDNVPALLQLAPFINGLLDYLEVLSDAQLRLVFRVFTAIAGANDDQSAAAAEGVRNELRILMHKQLSHSEVTYKRIGVIGAVTHLTSIAGVPRQDVELSDEANEEASDLVRTLFERASALPTCMALLFDELASRVPLLHPLLVSHVLSSLLHVLPPLRVCAECDVNDERALWYGHTAGERSSGGEARCCDVIGAARLQEQNLLRPTHQQTRDAAADAAAALAASLRLAQAATRALRSGSIGDALRSSLHMFPWHASPSSLAPAERMTQARAIFCAGDWLRETASGAALDVLAEPNWSIDDPRLTLVRARIDDMLENERRLELFLRVLPDFALPSVNGGAPLLRIASKSGGAGSKRGGSSRSKKAAKKKSAKQGDDEDAPAAVDNEADEGDEHEEEEEDEDVEEIEVDDAGAVAAAAAAAPLSAGVVDVGDSLPLVDQLRPIMRELDVATFAALAHRGPIGALCIEALANDFAHKLAAHAALEKPLTARRVHNSGAAMFLATHSPVSALTLVASAIGALATHATRLHAQLTNRMRTLDPDNDVTGADEAVPQVDLPGGVPDMVLECDASLTERAFVAICHALTAVFRSSCVRRLASVRDVLLTRLTRCISSDCRLEAPRGALATFAMVFNHFARLGASLPKLAQLETAAALLDLLGALADVEPRTAVGGDDIDDDDDDAGAMVDVPPSVTGQLSALADGWLRATWARHADGKFRAEPLRRVVHACAHYDGDKILMLRALAHAAARFVLAERTNGGGADATSPVPPDDEMLERLLPPTHALVENNDDEGGDDDDSDVPLSRRVRLVESEYRVLTATTWSFWVAATHSELVNVFRNINTAPSPRYVENVKFICDVVRIWRVVLETCNLGANVHIMRSLMKDGTTAVALIANLTKSYLQMHMIECIEPLSALFEDVTRCSHLLHAGCETTKDKKDALLAPLVPRAKRMLEQLSLTLRAALTANKLNDSFSLFVHRDMHAADASRKPKKARRKDTPKIKSSPPATARR
jgi:hypothetical protein